MPIIMVSVVLATLLDEHQADVLRAFLERDVPGNLFGLSVLERWGPTGLADAEWWGVFGRSDALEAACYAGARKQDGGFGLVVPSGSAQANRLIGTTLAVRGGASWVVGDREACDALWAGLGDPAARLCLNQVLFEATTVGPGERLEIRPGSEDDFEWLYSAAATMVKEDLSLPWGGHSPEIFAERLRVSIREGAEYVGSVANRTVYRAKRGTLSTYGAQIGGIWVEPSARGQGLGGSGTRAVTAALLAQAPRVTLHVREDNQAAIRCYESSGFEPIRAFRLLVR